MPCAKREVWPRETMVCVVNRSCSFDDVSNKDFNTSLIRNVLSVTEGTLCYFNTVKRK